MTDKERLVEILEKAGSMRQYPGTMARILIENGVTFATDNNVGSKWIPVAERLPKKGAGKVLVVKQYRGKSYIEVGEVIEGEAFCYSDDYCINRAEHKFTHWMPLPEAPKEE